MSRRPLPGGSHIAVEAVGEGFGRELAIAWVAAKRALLIIGPRMLAQLENNLAVAKMTPSKEQIARLDEVSAIPPVSIIRRWRPRSTC